MQHDEEIALSGHGRRLRECDLGSRQAASRVRSRVAKGGFESAISGRERRFRECDLGSPCRETECDECGVSEGQGDDGCGPSGTFSADTKETMMKHRWHDGNGDSSGDDSDDGA